MEEDAKDSSFDGGNPLLSMNPAKEYLFGELSSADLHWLLTPSSSQYWPGHAKHGPCPATSTLSAKRTIIWV